MPMTKEREAWFEHITELLFELGECKGISGREKMTLRRLAGEVDDARKMEIQMDEFVDDTNVVVIGPNGRHGKRKDVLGSVRD